MIPTAKADLRRHLRQVRRTLDPTQRRTEEAATGAALVAVLDPGLPLASYLALPEELDVAVVHQAWWSAGRPVWLPRVVGADLTWHPVTSLADCQPGTFGVREPDPARVPPRPLPDNAIILVPGVGFDARGGRLGQGKGFYDRTLAHHPGLTIGIGYACQEVADIPREAHDRDLHRVLLGGSWRRGP